MRESATLHIFATVIGQTLYTLVCQNNEWSADSVAVPLPPISGTPKNLGTASQGSSVFYSRSDHVHKMPSASDVGAYALPSGGVPKTDLAVAVQSSLNKADTAFQTAQGSAHAGEFVVVGSNGNLTTIALSSWQGGSYGT